MSLEPKPAEAATVTSPTSSPRPSIASCTSARSFSWSASPSVRTEYVMPAPPEKASRSAEPLDPMEACTCSMPSMPRSASSTGAAASDFACRLAVGPRSCVTVMVF
ncbi:Uncharacterised protein [Mycobacterium tuberculosis]|nr:Uncharacterised protein [Mycobacterium tuberculosis]